VMQNSFSVAMCIMGAIADFALWTKLRKFKVRENPPRKLARLSVEARRRRVMTASWILFSSGWFFLAATVLLFWLGNSR